MGGIEDMAYEHKEYIEMFLSIHDKDEQRELDEVYKKAEAFDEMKRDIFSTIRTLQAEKPRTRDHLIAIGTYQTVLNRMDEYDLDGGDSQ